MSWIADRFKVLMLDERSRVGAAMISSGGCYWRNGAGGIGVSHNGFFLDLNAREAGQVKAVLPIAPGLQPMRLPEGLVPAHLRNLLLQPLDGWQPLDTSEGETKKIPPHKMALERIYA